MNKILKWFTGLMVFAVLVKGVAVKDWSREADLFGRIAGAGAQLGFQILLKSRYPASAQPDAVITLGRDPSYQIYQKYRYAYEKYGYLFLAGKGNGDGQSENPSPDAPDWVSLVSGGVPGRTVSGGGEPEHIASGQDNSSSQTDGASETGADQPSGTAALAAGVSYSLEQLMDYDFLMKHFYSVHTSTTAGRDVMNAETFLSKDMRLVKDPSVPQILIYHTHTQETYADYGPENRDATVVGIGNYLTELLQQKGWNVIHDTTTYDIKSGKLDRNRAYTYALEGITAILQENPSIQVVLDLHRDGVRENVHLISDINGKPTASIMFFQGMSRTPDGVIEYLPNPYLEDNLAFAFQMQLGAAGRYPGLTRKIYLKGLRYNLHVRPRSALIEVGAQTNSYQEAQNAMLPLSELLDMVLQGG